MGFLYKGACYPDLSSAAAAQCSAAGQSWGSTTSAYTVECTANTTTALTMCRRLNGSTCTNYSQPVNVFPSCSYDGTSGLALDYFGAVLGFLVIVYVASKLKRIFWNSHESI